MKKFLLIFLLFFNPLNKALAQSLTADQIYTKINNAIVTIYTFDANGKPLAQGSGVVLNQKGWVVTNYHVYEGAEKLVVKQKSKIIEYSGIIGSDPEKDILILKIAGHSFPSITIGNSKLLKVGQKIYAIGSPLGFENTITEGIISGIRSNKEKSENFIQISAAISSGSSGGAVVNSKGELVAITTATVAKGQNLNFAIPVNDILSIYNKVGALPKIKSLKLVASNSSLYPIKENNKYGFINKFGQIIIQPKYEDGREFKENLAAIKLNGKWGYIDKTGRMVITPHFDEANDFYEGLAKIRIASNFGFIDKAGRIIIKPQFKFANNFTNGFSLISISGKYGLINRSGKLVQKPEFEESFFDYDEDMAKFKMGGKYGFLNKKGEIVIKPIFDEASYFHEGLAKVSIGMSQRWTNNVGYIDKSGNYVIEPQFNSDAKDFYEGLAVVSINNKFGYINKNGEIKIPVQFSFASIFCEGLAWVSNSDSKHDVFGLNAQYGCIDKRGKFIISPDFYWPIGFSEGLAAVKFKKSNGDLSDYGYINTKGEVVIQPQFKMAWPFKDGWAEVKVNLNDNHSGIINKSGMFINNGFITGDLIKVWIDKDFGYKDKNGNWIWKPQQENN